jgi:hypothetical protein
MRESGSGEGGGAAEVARRVKTPRCCRVMGKVLLLSKNADRILDVLDNVPYAFTTFTYIHFLYNDQTAAEKLMISADSSGVATTGISSLVLDVSHQQLKPLIEVTTMILDEAPLDDLDVHTLTFDDNRTNLAGGKRFFFVKKSYAEKGKLFRPPVTSIVWYPAGTGLPMDWE